MATAQKLGKYNLKRHIATGGMAEIWLAEQTGPGGFNKELVLKRILPHLASDTTFATMFLDEARLAAQLSHPKIAQIYELGEIDGEYFIAMEFIDGLDCSDLIEMVQSQPGTHIPIPIVCKIIGDVLEALDYAHDFTDRNGEAYQLVHRDISPQNVMVSNDGVIKLVDFGVAKAAANQSKTQPGGVKGKFAYMAPEQIQSKSIDRRADLYACGLVLFELLTLTKPFGDELQAVTGIISLEHADPRTIRPDIPAALISVINRAMQKDRDQRYPEADEMNRDIQVCLQSLGTFVSDRDVSAYVRDLRGLPSVRTSVTQVESPYPGPDSSPAAFSPTLAGVPTPVPMTAPEYAVAGPVPNTPTTGSPAFNPSEAPQATPLHTHAMPAQAEESNSGLVAIMAIVAIAILAAFVGLVIYFSNDQTVTTSTKTKTEVTKVETKEATKDAPKETPFNHPGGIAVSIATKSGPATVLYEGKAVGKTPLVTNLRPGTYSIEIRSAKIKMQRDLVISANKPFHRFKF